MTPISKKQAQTPITIATGRLKSEEDFLNDLSRKAFTESIFQPSLSAVSSMISKEIFPISFSEETNKMASIADRFFKLPPNHNELSERLDKVLDLERSMLYVPSSGTSTSIKDRIKEDMTEVITDKEINEWSAEQLQEALKKIDETETDRELRMKRMKIEHFRKAHNALMDSKGIKKHKFDLK